MNELITKNERLNEQIDQLIKQREEVSEQIEIQIKQNQQIKENAISEVNRELVRELIGIDLQQRDYILGEISPGKREEIMITMEKAMYDYCLRWYTERNMGSANEMKALYQRVTYETLSSFFETEELEIIENYHAFVGISCYFAVEKGSSK